VPAVQVAKRELDFQTVSPERPNSMLACFFLHRKTHAVQAADIIQGTDSEYMQNEGSGISISRKHLGRV